eukprot:2190986-Pleurochrysis_carterae.AAC.1
MRCAPRPRGGRARRRPPPPARVHVALRDFRCGRVPRVRVVARHGRTACMLRALTSRLSAQQWQAAQAR